LFFISFDPIKSLVALYIQKLNASWFRNYDALRLDLSGGAQAVVLTGANGSGKTNILEMISFLSPGRGLRGADLPDISTRGGDGAWAVSADIKTPDALSIRIGTGFDCARKRRDVRIDGRDVKNATELSRVLSVVWLTPQMDGIFIDSASTRRAFLDRLVMAFDPDHAARLNRFERKMRERLKLLKEERTPDARWLSSLEAQMAADSVTIAAARLDLAARLHDEIGRGGNDSFPQPGLTIAGAVEERLHGSSALDAEHGLCEQLETARGSDRETGRTHHGAHRSDLQAVYAETGMPAGQCSTGEQKALLVSILLAHAALLRRVRGFAPLILLDEVAAHLDTRRRDALFERLMDLGSQIWLTGTDRAIFSSLFGRALFFDVAQGRVTSTPALQKAAS